MTHEVPLYGPRDYPLESACDRLLRLANFKAGPGFRVLLWTNPKGFHVERGRFGQQEVEHGYYAREEDFLNEMVKTGSRWRWERASNYEQLDGLLETTPFDAVVILGTTPANIVRKAVSYSIDPRGPKTVLLEFEKRAWDRTDPFSVWSYLGRAGQLHLMRNFVHLVSRKGLLKYLPPAYRRATDMALDIWDVPAQKLEPTCIERLFRERLEEGPRLDYKRAAAVKEGKELDKLVEKFCAMANARGGSFVIGVAEIDGRPVQPIDAGLEDVGNPDAVINRIQQKVYNKFGRSAPELEFASLRTGDKNIVIVQVAESVVKRCGLKVMLNRGEVIPLRQGRMTNWVSASEEIRDQSATPHANRESSPNP
jgi:hypothetical protein